MDKIIKPGITLFVIATVAATLLGWVYELTAEPIRLQEEKIKTVAMQAVLPEATEFVDEEVELSEGVVSYTIGKNNGEVVGYVIGTIPKGYAGPISMLTGIDNSGIITGIEFVDMKETPGLGLNAKSESFKNKFIGKTYELKVVKGTPTGNQIDAMTSATVTTQAVVNGVNAATEFYAKEVQ